MASIPEPISRDLSEINILHCISRLCAKEMPAICVAAGCSNLKDDVQGTSLYEIPFFEDDRLWLAKCCKIQQLAYLYSTTFSYVQQDVTYSTFYIYIQQYVFSFNFN